MKKTIEELKTTTFKNIDMYCKDIAQARRISEIEGIDVEEFDEYLNACCTKWAEYYQNMSPAKLALDAIREIITAGDGEDFMNSLINDIWGDEDGKKDS